MCSGLCFNVLDVLVIVLLILYCEDDSGRILNYRCNDFKYVSFVFKCESCAKFL